jgi:hypothetical protein
MNGAVLSAGRQNVVPSHIFEDESFQDHLVALLTRDIKTLRECARVLHPDDFKPIRGMHWGRPRWITADRALNYYLRFHEPAGKLLLSDLLDYAQKISLGERQVAEIREYWKHLEALKTRPRDAIIPHCVTYKRERIKAAGIQELVELQAAGRLTDERWQEISARVLAAAPIVEPVSGAALYAAKYSTPQFALRERMGAGLSMLVAKPKEGKTWLAMQVAIAFVRGVKILGSWVRVPGPVLYCALEDSPRRISERLRVLAPEVDAAEFEQLRFLHAWDGTSGLRLLLEKEHRAGKGYKLVVIDPFLGMSPERKTNDVVRADYQELQPLRQLAQEFQTAILLVHHQRKAPGAARDTVIGTTGVTAGIDTLWVLERDPESDQARWLLITGRDVRERTLKIEFARVGEVRRSWEIVCEGPEADAGPVGRDILALVKRGGPLYPREIAKSLGKAENTVRENLFRLRKRDLVRREQGGRYAYPKD